MPIDVNSGANEMKTRILGLICIAVLCIILTLGLWPFHSPKNEVSWLKGRSGLEFDRNGTAITADAFQTRQAEEQSGGTLEIWLQPGRIWDLNDFLGFSVPENPFQLVLRQSQMDLEIQAKGKYGQRTRAARLHVDHVFQEAKPVFLTITSSLHGTSVYVDGVLVNSASQFRLSPLNGRLVVGDSAGQGDSWTGKLFGLAIYHRELKAPQVAQHFEAWKQKGRPNASEDERNVALYLLDEHSGRTAHNKAGSDLDLFIPERYIVVDQIFLEPFWQEFNTSRGYWAAALKNIVGFIPLGFFFYPYLATFRIKRVAVATVGLGIIVSLTIEVLQSYLPTRDSGMTDIITNTLGTWIGVASHRLFGHLMGGVDRVNDAHQ